MTHALVFSNTRDQRLNPLAIADGADPAVEGIVPFDHSVFAATGATDGVAIFSGGMHGNFASWLVG